MGGVTKFVAGVALLAVGIFVPGAGLAVAKAGFYLANLGLLEEISKLFVPKPKRQGARVDVEYSGTTEPRRIIYGEIVTSGLNCIRPHISGANGQYLHQVIAIAGHQVESITDVYFNQTTIASANISAVNNTADSGKVTSGTYANKAWIRRYVGTTTQAVDFILNAAASFWPVSAQGRGVAYVALQYELDEEVYATGKPDVRVKVRGKKCYDPRLDTSPGANPNNATYIAWTFNPALCLADYLRDTKVGGSVPATAIDWDLVVAAANICDENVTVPSGTQDRYTCNVVLLAAQSYLEAVENIKTLAGAMMGVCYRRGGKYRMFAGDAQSPVFTLTASDLVGPYRLRRETPIGEKYNYVRGQYIDKDRDYQQVDFQPRSDATFETNDGGRFPKEVAFDACTNEFEAQRNAIILRRQSRLKQVLTAPFALSAYTVRPWDIGTVTIPEIGWNAQRVQCIGWTFNPEGSVELVLREDLSSVWDDPTSPGDYGTPGSLPGGTPTNYTPRTPTNLVAKAIQDGIVFSWTAHVGALATDVTELWEHTSSTPFSSATRIWTGRATTVTIPKNDTTTRYYWIRARAQNGKVSGTNPASVGVAGKALAVAGGLSATVSSASVEKEDTGATITTASVTVTPTGGTSPYTHAWTKVTGGSITATAASSATTAFQATSMTSGEVRTATFRDTVTDNVAATATVDVEVRIERIVFNVTLDDYNVFKNGTTSTLTTNDVTATPNGGVPTYSYSWAKLSGDSITATASTSAVTAFQATGMAEDENRTAVFRVTVTDSTGGTPLTATADCNVTINRSGTS